MKHQDWQRDSRDERPDTNHGERLNADNDDAPAWLHKRQRPNTTPLRRFANVFGVLAVFAFSLYLLAEYSSLGDLLKAKTNGLLNPATQSIALPSIDLDRPTPRQTAAPYPIQNKEGI